MTNHRIPLHQDDHNTTTVDFLEAGKTILERTQAFKYRVQDELLAPIGKWLDDPDFMTIVDDADKPDWAKLKAQQRFNDMVAAHEALKQKRLDAKKAKEIRRYINGLIPRSKGMHICAGAQLHSTDNIHAEFIADLVAPFSPIEQHRAEVAREFVHALQLSVSNLLPWKLLITSDIQAGAQQFNTLNEYHPNAKADRISKFQHLLQMANDGEISLDQEQHTGDITITGKDLHEDYQIIIKDQAGNIIHKDWHQDLSDAQRTKIIADTIHRKIICKTGDR